MTRLKIALVSAVFLLLTAGVAYAQTDDAPEANGSIRGTVYLDKDGDGKCTGEEKEPVHAGTPIEFVSNDGKYTTFLQSGSNGTYGLVAAGYGTWKVSARPNANDFVVTSKPTLNVFISKESPLALGIDFCIREKKGVTTPAVLPAAGGAASNVGFVVALGAGFSLLAAGAFVEGRRRWWV